MSDLYYQCKLERNGARQVAWIPERGAIQGRYIELKDDDTMWKVEEVYEGALTEKYLREKQRADRNSLPSIK